MDSYYDKRFNKKILYKNPLIIQEVQYRTGGDENSLLKTEASRVRLSFAAHEYFQYGTLVMRDIYKGKFHPDKYTTVDRSFPFTQNPLLRPVSQKLHAMAESSKDKKIIVYDYEYNDFLIGWFKLIAAVIHKHSKREIQDSLKSAGFKHVVCANVPGSHLSVYSITAELTNGDD